MTVRVYKSSDASAPSLTGVAGSLVTILDACLVNGYGSQTAAGWTIAYTGTSKRTYRNSATDGTGFYLYVDDSASVTAKEALMTGFQSATGLGTGTGQFPTFAQLAIGIGAVVCRKSNTADSTVRSWTLVADDTVFYLFTETGDYISPTLTMAFMFGDIFSYATTDPYKCMIIGRNASNSNGNSAEPFLHLNCSTSYTISGHFIAANFNGVGGSLAVGKHSDMAKLGGAGAGSSSGATSPGQVTQAMGLNGGGPSVGAAMAYPNAADGGIWMAPVWIHHNGIVRGYLKGLWCPLHNLPLNHNDTFTGTGAMSGKTFLCQQVLIYANYSALGECLLETSNTWS